MSGEVTPVSVGMQAFADLNFLVLRRDQLKSLIASKEEEMAATVRNADAQMVTLQEERIVLSNELMNVPAKAEELMMKIDTRQEEIGNMLGMILPNALSPAQ